MEVIPIHEMIDMFDNFFADDMSKRLTVGGCVGTHVFRYALKESPYEFIRTLVVEGCQDYVGLMEEHLPNVVFYADLFCDRMVDPLNQVSDFTSKFYRKDPEYIKYLSRNVINNYDFVIINDGHLIPDYYRLTLDKVFTGKLLTVVDPFDIGGDKFYNVKTVVDSLDKQSFITSLARKTIGVDTRVIDKKVRCSVKQGKMQRRSIGRIDDKQYITNDPEIIENIRKKQYLAGFRKNYKVIVCDDMIDHLRDENGTMITLCQNSMVTFLPILKASMFDRVRPYHFKNTIASSFSYEKKRGLIHVQPANIISVEQAAHHRFGNVVLVVGSKPYTKQEMYSVIKNANNVTVVEFRW